MRVRAPASNRLVSRLSASPEFCVFTVYTPRVQYAAFLRAINVGKHNRVKMEDLRALCTSLGSTNVSTYLQTGNIAFESDDPENVAAVRLEEALLGIGLRNAAAIVRTREELQELVSVERFAALDAERFARLVTLFRGPLPGGEEVVLPPGPLQLVEVRQREVLTALELGGRSQLDLNGYFERKFKLSGTTRYWNVVTDFAARM